MILSESDPAGDPDPMTIALADVSRAHFYAQATRDVYIQLPKEDERAGESDVCGKLLRTMYGTLDAAEKWGEHYAQILVSAGFARGRASPCHFSHPTWGVHLLVHGDDFVIVARREGRAQTLKLLQDNFEIKHTCAGPCQGMDREIKILGRIITCHPDGWTMEADPSLIEAAVDKLGLQEGKGVAVPGSRPEGPTGGLDMRARRMAPMEF